MTVALGCLILDCLRKEKLKNNTFENVGKLRCWRIVLTNEIFIYDQLKIIFGQCFLAVISELSVTASYLNMLKSSKRVKVILSLFTP